ncbi:O-antigen ligase family protein [Photobacterium sagamiensis]|uniref:O-antigen ligase family protein n=1 Tax=Photobacterium sagamiensis TaxID=2910241 RepID=UPI003D12186E
MTLKITNPLLLITNSLVFLFAPLCLTVDGGYNLIPMLLLVLALPLLFRAKKTPLTQELKWLIAAFFGYFILFPISVYFDGGRFSDIDQASRAVMAVIILLLLLRYPPKFGWLLNSFAAGSLASGAVAIHQVLLLNQPRAFAAYINAIQGGNIAMSLGLLSLCGAVFYLKQQRNTHALVFLIAAAAGIVGSLLSGSRGGWIGLPVIIAALIYLNRSWLSRRCYLTILLAILAVSTVFLQPSSGMQQRFNAIGYDIAQYQNGNSNTSIGIRLDLWKSAYYSIKEKPLFGWGVNGRHTSQLEQVKANIISQRLYGYSFHAHNQYLEDTSIRGLLGLVALLGLFAVPLVIYKRYSRSTSSAQQTALASCGVVFVVSVASYCLTQSFLSHNSGIIFYCFVTICIIASLVSLNNEQEEKQLASLNIIERIGRYFHNTKFHLQNKQQG